MRYVFCFGLLAIVSLSARADDLLSIYKRAVLASPELSGSEFAVEIARAQEDQAFGQLLPKVDLMGNYSLNRFHSYKSQTRTSPPFNCIGKEAGDFCDGPSYYPGIRASITATQPLFDVKAYLLMKSQEDHTAQSQEELLAAHQKLIMDLVDRYLEALEARDKTEIIATELSSTEKQLARVESLQARQLALITDLYEIQARTETLRTNLIDSDNEAKVALEKLRELTGDAVDSVLPVRLDFTQLPPENAMAVWVQDAGLLNPELRALNHAVESAKHSILGYQAGHLPRIELQVSGNYSNTVFNNQSSGRPYDIGTVGVQATIPLYQGGITSAQVREAEGRKGLNEAKREQKLRELEKLTRAAFLDMSASPARSQAADRQLAASEKARDAMIEGYELGVVTIVDLLHAEEKLSEARKIQRQARYRYIKARSMLLFQTGRLFVEELAMLNSWLAGQTADKSNSLSSNYTVKQ